MQIWAESGKSALPICNYSQILYQFLTFTQNLKRSHHVPSSIATWKPINHATAVLLFASICNFYLIAAVFIVGVGKIVSYYYF